MSAIQTNKTMSFIKKDISKLQREQKEEERKPKGKTGKSNEAYLLAYLITRKNTLKEILNMLES